MSDRVAGRPAVRVDGGGGLPYGVDPLEARVLLAASPRLTLSAVSAASTLNAGVVKHKASSATTGLLGALTTAYSTYQGRLHSAASAKWWHVRRAAEAAATKTFRTAVPNLLDVSADAAAVNVTVRGSTPIAQLRAAVTNLGLRPTTVNGAADVIQGFVPIASLQALPSLPGVRAVTPALKPFTRQQGKSPDQGDQVEKVDQLRAALASLNLDGTGVKVGVLSDSVSQSGGGLADSQATGDLPADVQVIADGPAGATDEGRAMLEEIHDLAPGASLAFATAGSTQQEFADNVRALFNAGCTVIVDDIGFFDEPFFQEGVIDRAIDDVTAGGAIYLSASGNDGSNGFEQVARYVSGTDPFGDATQLVNFAPAGSAVDTKMSFTTKGGVLTFEWDEPYDGVSGSATTDLDVYLFNSAGTKVLYSAIDDNVASGDPIEIVSTDSGDPIPAGTYRIEVALGQPLAAGDTLPDRYRMVFNTNDNGGLANTGETPLNRGSVYGHSAGPNTVSVGAVDYTDAPPFSSTTPVRNETYSDFGPADYVFDVNGNRLPSIQVLQKPDVSGVDGIDTSFFGGSYDTDGDGLPNFFGTSAAAPNVAAVAALLRQLKPDATPQQLTAVLSSTARALNAAAAGTWDVQGGYGLVDALAAAKALASAPVTISLPDGSDNAVVISKDPDGIDADVTVNGGDVQRFPLLLISAFTVTGGDGNDTLTLDFSSGNPLPATGITFDGAGNNNALRVIGTTADDTLAATSNAAATFTTSALGTVPIQLANVQTLRFPGGSGGNDQLRLDGGTWQVDADTDPNVSASPNVAVTVNANAAATFTGDQHLASLTINGGSASLPPGSTAIVTLAGNLAISNNGTFDLGSGSLLTTAPAAQVRTYLAATYDAGKWDGHGGITSAYAAAHPTYAIGYAPTTNGPLLVKPALIGDTNLDGAVTFGDYQNLLSAFGTTSGATWYQGDFNYDAAVTFGDYQSLLSNFGKTSGV